MNNLDSKKRLIIALARARRSPSSHSDKYEMLEELTDGTKMTKAGEYILNSNQSPATIDFCLGQFDQEEAEWTTLSGYRSQLNIIVSAIF